MEDYDERLIEALRQVYLHLPRDEYGCVLGVNELEKLGVAVGLNAYFMAYIHDIQPCEKRFPAMVQAWTAMLKNLRGE